MTNTNPVITHVQQTQSKLCWAACIKMALQVKGHRGYADITPQSIADNSIGIGGINKAMDSTIIKSAFQRYGFSVVHTDAVITWAAVKTEIDNNRPVMIGINWKEGGGHVMLIGGYEEEAKGGGAPFNWISLNDPLNAASSKIFFDKITGGRYEPGGKAGEGNKWEMTIKMNWA